MQTAKQGDTVVIHYVVRATDDRVIGAVDADDPQTLTLGMSEIFPAIEAALEGMEVGTTKQVAILADQAFGPRRDDLIVQIPLASVDPRETPKPGMALNARQPDGTSVKLIIIDITDGVILADGNHPLAGEDLEFEITLAEIKPTSY
ncbi:MAG: FKBP-type peptidyl-prolyl cis-trans isomerase [Hyphomonadaceae bacterium]|nr:FKBP-type peptidyl-prolyl cis-trans isomerase [Hyphomonadaceae bacterium]